MIEGTQEEIDKLIAKHIGKIFGSLEDRSIKYFLETGHINGSFRKRLTEMLTDYSKQQIDRLREEVMPKHDSHKSGDGHYPGTPFHP